MGISNVTEHEIMIKIVDRQLEFLENKAKELGLSKEELIRQYIAKAINDEHEKSQKEQRLTQIHRIKGKYKTVLSSSENFAQQKQEEIQLEK